MLRYLQVDLTFHTDAALLASWLDLPHWCCATCKLTWPSTLMLRYLQVDLTFHTDAALLASWLDLPHWCCATCKLTWPSTLMLRYLQVDLTFHTDAALLVSWLTLPSLMLRYLFCTVLGKICKWPAWRNRMNLPPAVPTSRRNLDSFGPLEFM